MKLYVAHNFCARDWLPEVVRLLETFGHDCTSTWIFDDAHTKGGSKALSAKVDLDDIDRSDALVLFIDQDGPTPGRGKYFEFGYAYAKGMPIYLVGTEENCVFYALPGVYRAESPAALVVMMEEYAERT